MDLFLFQTRYLSVEFSSNIDKRENEAHYCLLIPDSKETEPSDNVEGGPNSSEKETSPVQNGRDILFWHEYSIWLDCPINNKNRRYLMLATLLLALALFFGISLSSLSVCKPVSSTVFRQINVVEPQICIGIFGNIV